jgi:hypothetical protein
VVFIGGWKRVGAVKLPRPEPGHPLPITVVEVKNVISCSPTSSYVFMAWYGITEIILYLTFLNSSQKC